MVKEKEASTGKKIGKIFLWILASIGILFAILFVYFLVTGAMGNKDVDKLLALEDNYLTTHDKLFVKEYQVADPSQVTSLSVLSRAVTAATEAKKYLVSEKGNITEILVIVEKIKPDYSGDKLAWLENMKECYTKRNTMANLYEEVLTNELIYFTYYENSEKYQGAYQEFTLLLNSYITAKTEQELIDVINKMKTKVSEMQDYAKKAYAAVPFTFFQKREAWADKYNQGLDLELKYIANPTTDNLKQMNDKFSDALKSVEGVTSNSIKEEFDKWYNEKITLKIDEADRQFNGANTACDSASNAFATAFPGNANVVKDIEDSIPA